MRRLAMIVTLLVVGCAPVGATEKGPEEDAPLDGALDSFRSPTDHGPLVLGSSVTAEITADEAFHAWTFELTGEAAVTLRTEPGEGGRVVDTMLYLYREGPRGWGSYLVRNDDHGGTLFSAISRTLPAGRYRALVKGYHRLTRGPFTLAAECSGAGCPAAESCLFGRTFRELRDSAAFEPLSHTVITEATAGTLSAARAAQVLGAVRVAYEEAGDLAAALESVDQNEINLLELRELVTGRTFRVLEYGAGDNSYGAAFVGDEPAIVAEIHDGDLIACTVLGEQQGARAGADCGGESDPTCAEGLICQGFVEAWGAGKCAPTGPVEGEGEACAADGDCASEALICAGLTRGDQGMCLPLWMRGSTGEGYALEIPETTEGLQRSAIAYGLATVDVDVEIRALIQHPRHADLRVTLANPVGTEVVVFDGAPGSGALELDGPVRGFSGDEQVNGEWRLVVLDRRAGSTGTLERWAVDITSRWD